MSGPERIWATAREVESMTKPASHWVNPNTAIEYLRRDIADTLRGYCQHDDDCTINRYPDAGACSCGLSAALAKMGE